MHVPDILKLYCPHDPDRNLSLFINPETFQATGLADCEFILHPDLVRDGKKELPDITDRYKKSGRKVLVFVLADYEYRYPYFKNLIVLRTSLRASKKRPNELTLPYLWECREVPFPVLPAGTQPRIGFCGQVSPVRRKLMLALEKSPDIESSFIKRASFWGGAPHDKKLIEDFYSNLEENHFVVAQRGAGNFSMRFYQALAVGRIPVLVNTDMVLPFENEIPWKELIVFEKNPRACILRIIEIHANGNVERLQEQCAQLFQTWFSPKNYLAKLTTILRTTMK